LRNPSSTQSNLATQKPVNLTLDICHSRGYKYIDSLSRRETKHHHNSTTQFTATSALSFTNFPELAHPDWIEAEVLTVVGEQAATRVLSEAIHERLTTKKQLLVVPGAGHVDLYHRKDLIPFEEISAFLDKTLG
jgi:hydrolase of the alpha/beta superfamily-like protein